ncbi:hypothetical protein MTR67_027141 [Solanum verrucosum]|uniref:Uncharacterized protein n=1 Tax=Solanum verrucosum TaxID=315347 RepID=A0AAF0TV40_SOLVR|nr:hypothetical protein MTR67_027141 [Solanum verrucosum]
MSVQNENFLLKTEHFYKETREVEEGNYLTRETQSFELKLIGRVYCVVFPVRCLEFFLPTTVPCLYCFCFQVPIF